MKFVSYNIQYGIGMDGRFDLGRIAKSIEGADIIALQEVTRGFVKNNHADLVASFAELFSDYFHVYAAPCDVLLDISVENGRRIERRFQFGNMILSRWPILATRHLLLPRSRTIDKLNLQRGALEAVIAAPDGPVRVYSVHLDHVSPDERLSQIRYLKDRVLNFVAEGGGLTGAAEEGFPDPPLPEDFILMGDFNMEPESPEYIAMVGRQDRYYSRSLRANEPVDVLDRLGLLSPQSFTWAKPPGDGPVKMHLDHCFVNSGLAPRLKNAWVDHNALGSDHFPLWIEVD
ncbi:endonuclease/exonuclease/phosphatase family metal-dependent hydrolase [Neorhizobium sp. R1-B]|jgi:endonuclease/exonuclease/phosphatase family metal-dependent hydrolase|uniref:endonuclease/exonuclease/phosphatase family protein n=1 Tax=unclassified Neorhizobium TaxID=2629175 RepID=UPI0010493B3F|nr:MULTISPECIES: endonuclease/exonuclease/phosphatase family protein [unclassified Neorhizobium]TCV70454.1 endonuclease/exonuclease/phosphatase family metal-dependent hydrolase [Neorhizobium sp. S3-V5DH]TDX81928.1 endonuclease/exonuclease/phosphatase family metal-dependent hydrolase [Neorhizobium sp. R1-B]